MLSSPTPHAASAAQMDEVEAVFAELPERLKDDTEHMAMDAAIIYPRQLKSPLVSYAVSYGGADCAFEHLQRELLPDAVVELVAADAQMGIEHDSQQANRMDPSGNSYIEWLSCYPGYLNYSGELPDEYLAEEIDRVAGKLEPGGVPRECSLSADGAKELAQGFLKTAAVDIKLSEACAYAISPIPEGRYAKGYFEIYVPQVIAGIPVAVENSCGISGGRYRSCGEQVTGFKFTIFDVGIVDVDACWLDESGMRAAQKYESLVTLDGALSVVREWAREWVEKGESGQVQYDTITIREIRFEYVLDERDGEMTLVPAWTFDTWDGVEKGWLSGVQIDATDGHIIRASEAPWL